MIKKFISQGLIGIPDCSIEFGDEKKVIITGPNGSGKTSLLRQITHPLSSANKFNRLKKGVEEGYQEMEINYYGREYKIKHLYALTGKTVKVSSYLMKKVDGEYVHLVENGLVTNFKSVVERELDYYDYLFDIFNIGSHNRGLIELTNSNRLEYLKKVTNSETLTILKENANTNFTSLVANGKYISSELEKYEPLEEMKRKVKLLESESLKLTKEREQYQLELGSLENIEDNSDDLSFMIQEKNKLLEEYDILESVLKDVVEDIAILPNSSYNSIYPIYYKSNLSLYTKLTEMTNRVLKLNEDLMQIKEVDNKSLNDEKKELHHKINTINNKYKDKTYPDLDLEDLYKLSDKIDYIIRILDKVDDDKLVIDLIYKNREEYIKEIEDKLNKSINEEERLNKDLKSLSISENLINLKYDDKCNIPKCPLRIEYENQINNLNLYQILNEKIIDLNEELNRLKEELNLRYNYINYSNDIEEILIDIKDNISLFINTDKLYKDKLIKLKDKINDSILYTRSMEDLEEYNIKLDSIIAILSVEEKNTNDRRNIILEEINSLQKEEESMRIKYSKVNSKFLKLENLNIDESLKNIKYKDLLTIKEKDLKEIGKLEEKIKYLKNINNRKKELNTLIIDKNKELKENTDLYYEFKSKISRSKQFTKEFEVIQNDIIKAKAVRDIVANILPAKVLKSYLYDIEKLVNDLLDGIMFIRFDTTEGIDIICTIKAEDRPASVLSQGEKSLLSVALLIAFKKKLKWDVISIDEGSAALDENNKDRYLNMITRYIETVDTIKQVFIVSHDFFVSDGDDIRIIKLGE